MVDVLKKTKVSGLVLDKLEREYEASMKKGPSVQKKSL